MSRALSSLMGSSIVALAAACAHDRVVKPSAPEAVRVAATVEGFAVEPVAGRRTESGGPAETARSAERASVTVLGASWKVTPRDDGIYEIRPGPAEASMPIGAAWERAYALREQPGVAGAEPLFEVEKPPGEQEGAQACRPAQAVREETLLFPGSDDPLAAGDPDWSLGPSGANVRPAQALIRALGREPGSGVMVGHPDTGYRRHPEIWPATSGPILADLGWNFLTDSADATDDLTFIFAGHGTRTASVIVSPDGDQLGAAPKHWVSGVAPGAKLVPMRVTRSVAMFDMSNLAHAIRRAAGLGPHPLSRAVDVVSISLGGPPSRDLHRAVREATARNVIVLAAAGNEVRIVVWPAHYDEVTAVAASNVHRVPWSGSSRGAAVDITAPGESVWCGGSRMQNGQAVDCDGMSSGTSFAVATIAGVAALWLDYHRDDPRLRALRDAGAVPWGFREVLRRTARPGPGDWDARRYGPGIVDALAVLQAEIPPPPARPESRVVRTRCDQDLEHFASLLERPVDARTRLAKLFGRPSSEACRVAPMADEIVFHYVLEERVGDALDPVLSRREPTPAQYQAAREGLRTTDLSARLRSALEAA